VRSPEKSAAVAGLRVEHYELHCQSENLGHGEVAAALLDISDGDDDALLTE
jgi:hypothetical protein